MPWHLLMGIAIFDGVLGASFPLFPLFNVTCNMTRIVFILIFDSLTVNLVKGLKDSDGMLSSGRLAFFATPQLIHTCMVLFSKSHRTLAWTAPEKAEKFSCSTIELVNITLQILMFS